MLTLDAATFSALGEGVLIPDNDLIYMGSSEWMLAFPFARNFFDEDLINLIHEHADNDARRYPDWKIITAREVFPTQFIPARGRRLQEISPYSNRRISADLAQDLFARWGNSIFGDTLSLVDMYRAGKFKPVYQKQQTRSTGSTASEYLYAGGPEHQRPSPLVIGMSAPIFDVFYNDGFDIRVPLDHYGDVPFAGLFKSTPDGDIYGLVKLLGGDLGVTHSPDGRELYSPASRACWTDPSGLVENGGNWFAANAQVYDPAKYFQGISVDELAKITKGDVPIALTILRWHGISDPDILLMVKAGEEEGLYANYQHLLQRARQLYQDSEKLLTRLQEGATYQMWTVTQKITAAEDICSKMDALVGLIGQDIDTSPVEEAINLVNAIGEMCSYEK